MKHLAEPAPSDAELEAILAAAVTVPDHGSLRPWRLVVITGEGREPFGDALAAAARRARPELPSAVEGKVRAKAFAAPTAIALVARVDAESNVPAWEQIASASCAGYAITLAAHHLGVGAIWKSSPFVDGPELAHVLDMGPADVFLGWVNLGRAVDTGHDEPRAPVDLRPIVRRLGADGNPSHWEGAGAP